MQILKRVLALVAIAGLFLGSPIYAQVNKSRARRSAENMLLRGVDFYENDQLESAMEAFLEVIRMGGTQEEVSLAKEYLDRITRRMSGQRVSPIHSSTSKPIKEQHPASNAGSAIQREALSTQDKKGTPPLSSDSSAAQQGSGQEVLEPVFSQDSQQEKASSASEVSPEYVLQKFSVNRERLIQGMLKNSHLHLVQRGSDKIQAISFEEKFLFETGSNFSRESAAALGDLAELIYFHPRHLIRIYPAWTEGRSQIKDLQRATVLGSYLVGRGLTTERIKVELERNPLANLSQAMRSSTLETLLSNREGRILVFLEELLEPLETHYFFTRSLPENAAENNYPILSLGLSRDYIKAPAANGIVIELFVNSRPSAITRWKLLLKDMKGNVLLTHEGKSAVLESVYFDGRIQRGSHHELLSAGKYFIEAEALNEIGGKVRISKMLDIDRAGSAKQENTQTRALTPRERIGIKKVAPIVSAKKRSPNIKQTKLAQDPSRRISPKDKKFGSGGKTTSVKNRGSPKIYKHPPAARSSLAVKNSAVASSKLASRDAVLPHVRAQERMQEGEVLTYRISFALNQAVVPKGERIVLEQISAAARAYPLQRFSLIGLASPDEKNAVSLAGKRANVVVKLLSSQYGLSSSRMSVDSGVGVKDQREVEISVEE